MTTNATRRAGLSPWHWHKMAGVIAAELVPDREPQPSDLLNVLRELDRHRVIEPVTLQDCRDLWALARAIVGQWRKRSQRDSDRARRVYIAALKARVDKPLPDAAREAIALARAEMSQASLRAKQESDTDEWLWLGWAEVLEENDPDHFGEAVGKLVNEFGIEALLAWPEVRAAIEAVAAAKKHGGDHD
jgi:hypothetical protein